MDFRIGGQFHKTWKNDRYHLHRTLAVIFLCRDDIWFFCSIRTMPRWEMSKLKSFYWEAVWWFSYSCKILSSWSYADILGRPFFGKSLTVSRPSNSHKILLTHDFQALHISYSLNIQLHFDLKYFLCTQSSEFIMYLELFSRFVGD